MGMLARNGIGKKATGSSRSLWPDDGDDHAPTLTPPSTNSGLEASDHRRKLLRNSRRRLPLLVLGGPGWGGGRPDDPRHSRRPPGVPRAPRQVWAPPSPPSGSRKTTEPAGRDRARGKRLTNYLGSMMSFMATSVLMLGRKALYRMSLLGLPSWRTSNFMGWKWSGKPTGVFTWMPPRSTSLPGPKSMLKMPSICLSTMSNAL
mmetsp:Transcript_80331/g.209523  ORF Transcript_80331/g.209523 Transcript_80331/m.209523 type:complete len:203 (-) Transcript_80331:1255-1863(-)